MDMELFAGFSQALINELIIITQRRIYQKANGGKLSAEKRDLLRADLAKRQGVDRRLCRNKNTEDSKIRGKR